MSAVYSFSFGAYPDEPEETRKMRVAARKMAVNVACTAAERAAIDTGHNHVVVRVIDPEGLAVYPAGHDVLESGSVVPLYEITPASECIRHLH